MKKREKKLQIHRDTLRRLDGGELGRAEMKEAAGGIESSCFTTDCCLNNMNRINN